MKYFLFILLTLSSCSVSHKSYSQTLHTSSNRAIKLYNEGMSSYDFVDLPKAESCFLEALKYDKKFYEAYMMLGELYTRQKKFSDAVISYREAISIDSVTFIPVFLSLADAEMMTDEYNAALRHYRKYLKYNLDQDIIKPGSANKKNRLAAEKNIKCCEFAIDAMKKPVSFNPKSVGSTINTSEDEYWPSITADGLTMMFTRQSNYLKFNQTTGPGQEDFYTSQYSENGWKASVNAGAPLNTSSNEGAQTLSSNGKYMYFTACERPGGFGSCDLYFSAFSGGTWSQPFNLGAPVNTNSWESTPSINADGNMLFFSSNRPGGFGGKDIWYSILNKKGSWADPVNLGEMINTSGDEMSPFIHFDGKTLYFASGGRPGMGGLDIFLARMNKDTTWNEPQNLGYPINSASDEMGLVIDAAGQRAYFSSKRDNSNGKDIFYFDLDESVRPDPVSYLKGKVTDKQTGKLLKADYELINLSTRRVTLRNSTDEDGNFLVCLPSGYNYGINVTKPGYLFYSESFMFEGQHSVAEPFIKRINLSPAKIGEKMLLSNVFYEIDSWELKNESVEELNNLVDLLTDNKGLIVEIGGYTDSTGTDDHNLVLSEKRALSVVNYLVEKGIIADRLKYKGYGNSSPVADNETTEGRRLNRRTEVKVIGEAK
jgi:outer membrane protein OmpA-like peptidoglycan-associated protein/tetratricopeptide (TPR) repeat protein